MEAISIPYITRATLLPTNIVEIYSALLFVNIPTIREAKIPCFLSNSMRNLFAEIKAISIPEKKAEKPILNNIKSSSLFKILNFCDG